MPDLRIIVEEEEKEAYKVFAKKHGFNISSLIRTSLKIIMEKPELLSNNLADPSNNLMLELNKQQLQMRNMAQMIGKLAKSITQEKDDFDPSEFLDVERWNLVETEEDD